MVNGSRSGKPRKRLFPLAIGAVLAITGCAAGPVAGTGFADQTALDKYSSAKFQKQLDLLDESLEKRSPFISKTATLDITGNGYHHLSWGEDGGGKELTTALMGNPPAVAVNIQSSQAGATLDTYHPAGSKYDYTLLGSAYRALAPTTWVAEPTVYDSDITMNAPYTPDFCQVYGLNFVCGLRFAIEYTMESEDASKMVKQVITRPDGSNELRATVKLESLLPGTVLIATIYPPDSWTSRITDEMRNTWVPVRIWQDPDGFLKKIEVNAKIDGEGQTFTVQNGFEITGTSERTDFPAAPSKLDVTILNTEQSKKLTENISKVNAR